MPPDPSEDIVRGEILIENRLIRRINEQLALLNTGKVGEPYKFPDELILMLDRIRKNYGLSYRELGKIIEEMSKYIGGLEKPNYSTIYKRIKGINPQGGVGEDERPGEAAKDMTIIVDREGISEHSQKEWAVRFWKLKKVYRKVTFAVDGKGRVSDIEIS